MKYTVACRMFRNGAAPVAVFEDHITPAKEADVETIHVEASNPEEAERVAIRVITMRLANRKPNYEVMDLILEETRKMGVSDVEVMYWLVSPVAYWEEQDEPFNHFDQPDEMIESVKYHFDRWW